MILTFALGLAVMFPVGSFAQKDVIQGSILYKNVPRPPFRLMFDYYHHSTPSIKVGKYITTGSWVSNEGRYGWDDFVHTNTMDHAYIILEKEYAITMNREPYSKQVLDKTDGVVIIAADNPEYVLSAKKINDKEILTLRDFVRSGGSLMVMLNGGGAGRFTESFESVQLKKLVNSFGLSWNDDDTHYSDITLSPTHPYFYDVPVFHYGAGCTINILPQAVKPEILMDVYSNEGYTDRAVKGAGIVMVQYGKGRFILVGDAGSWTGNLSRPWAENERILKQLFRYMKPDKGGRPADYGNLNTLSYEMSVAGLQAVPVSNSLSSVERPLYHMFSPRKQTNMPFIEASAEIKLTYKKNEADRSFNVKAAIENFKWFDQSPADKDNQNIDFSISRQGKVANILPTGKIARWIAPDISSLSALLPVEGLSPGDQWESVEFLRIPALRGTDLPSVRPLSMQVEYISDVEMSGKPVRLVRSSGELWLNELGVKVEDILPEEEIKKVNTLNYKFYDERGGKILFKKEQWIDSATGIVVRAKNQTRLIAWIEDVRKPVGNTVALKDNDMIVSLAHVVEFKLKN